MKKTMSMLMTILSLNSAFANQEFDVFGKELEDPRRLIEPTSPVLGYKTVTYIKNANIHPEEMYNNLLKDQSLEAYKTQIYTSLHTYLKTLKPGLDQYCSKDKVSTKDRYVMSEVEHAAIPLEVLLPFHDSYRENYVTLAYKNLALDKLRLETQKLAIDFQQKRYNCGTAVKLRSLENKIEKLCVQAIGLNLCKKSKKVNQILSSAEAAYPRIQFGINGFTRYVYDELLQETNLAADLKLIYDLEKEWIENDEFNLDPENAMFQYVVDNALSSGMHPKTMFLILAYSMRNMPSLDVEYAQSPEKALMLETYFWGFKDLKAMIGQKKLMNSIFANYSKRGLGIYHYLTGSLLACESRLANQTPMIAVTLSYFSKLGYKTDKLIKGVDKEKLKEGGFGYIKNLAKHQGFSQGLDAGEYGGKFGSKICGQYYKEKKKEYKLARREIRSKYSDSIIKGYKQVGPRGRGHFRNKLTGDDKALRDQYLSELENAKKVFEEKTRSILVENN